MLQSKSLYLKEIKPKANGNNVSSPVVFSCAISCNLIRVVKNASSTHAAASPVVDNVMNVVLKARHAAASTAASDSQTFPAATLSSRTYKSQLPRAKEITTKLASFDL